MLSQPGYSLRGSAIEPSQGGDEVAEYTGFRRDWREFEVGCHHSSYAEDRWLAGNKASSRRGREKLAVYHYSDFVNGSVQLRHGCRIYKLVAILG